MTFINPYRFSVDAGGPAGPIALAYRASTATINDGTAVPFDNEVYDTEDVFAPTSGNFVIPSDGLYRMSMVASNNDEEAIKQAVDGTWVDGGYGEAQDLTAPWWRSGISAPLSLSSGDNAQMLAAYGAINLGQSGGFYTAGSLERLPSDLKYARVNLSSLISSHTSGVLNWNNEVVDTDGFYSSGSPSRLTVPTGISRVRVTANLETESYTGNVLIEIRKNGSLVTGCVKKISGKGALKLLNLATPPLEVSSGDYFELFVQTAVAHSIQPAPFTWFCIEEVPSDHIHALVYASGSQTITNSADTVMLFDTEISDSEGLHSTSTNTGRLTVPAGVSYARLYFNGVTDAGTSNSASMVVFKNGAAFAGLAADQCDNNNGNTKAMSGVSAWVEVSEGDYFEVTGRTIGVDVTVTDCWFAIECV